MAAHAVVFANDPPAFLDVAAVIERPVLIGRRQRALLAAQEESGKRLHLLFGEVQVGHAQLFFFGFDLALVPNIGLSKLVLEEALVVIPRSFGGTFRKTRKVLGIGDRLAAAALRGFRQQSEVETLDG